MLHWLYIQYLLTLQQIRTDITIPHILSGILFFAIIHFRINKAVKEAAKTFRHKRTTKHPIVKHHRHGFDCPEVHGVLAT